MQIEEACHWLVRSDVRRDVFCSLKQPMTAKQLGACHSISPDVCSRLFSHFSIYDLVECLNPEARRSRLYWLTKLGRACQRKLLDTAYARSFEPDIPAIDWSIYGWVCYSHRAAIVKALARAMQPAEIKRRAKLDNPDLRMSANNVRDAIYLLLARGVVVPVRVARKAHLLYELTKTGKLMRELLIRAQTRSQ